MTGRQLIRLVAGSGLCCANLVGENVKATQEGYNGNNNRAKMSVVPVASS
jgi:hypothetical protein